MVQVAPAGGLKFVGCKKLLQPVLANRLKQPVARFVGLGVQHDQRLFDQVREQFQHVVARHRRRTAHRLGGGQCPSPCELRESAPQHALGFAQQLVAPVDERAQRLVAQQRRASAARQQREAIVQTFGHLLHAHCPNARCRQFQRQRNAVELMTDLRYGSGVLGGEPEGRRYGLGAFDEQLAGRIVEQRVDRQQGAGRCRSQRWQAPCDLAGHTQRFTAGRECASAGAAAQHLFGKRGAGLDQVLTVVEDQQHAAPAQKFQQGVEQRPGGLFVHVQRAGHRADDQSGVGDGGEFDDADTVREIGRQMVGDLERHPGLAHSASAHECQQVRAAQQREHRRHVVLASDERRLVGGQVVDDGGDRQICRRCSNRCRCGRRGDALVEHLAKTVAPPGHRQHRVGTEHLSQAGDVLAQVVLVDHQTGPDDIQKFIVRHNPVAPFDQHQQQVIGPGTDGQRLAVAQQQPLRWAQFEAVETI